MKLIVNSPMMGEKISSLLCDYHENGVKFEFIKKTGMKLEFGVTGTDAQSAADLAKALIRGTEFGKVLYFSVEAQV